MKKTIKIAIIILIIIIMVSLLTACDTSNLPNGPIKWVIEQIFGKSQSNTLSLESVWNKNSAIYNEIWSDVFYVSPSDVIFQDAKPILNGLGEKVMIFSSGPPLAIQCDLSEVDAVVAFANGLAPGLITYRQLGNTNIVAADFFSLDYIFEGTVIIDNYAYYNANSTCLIRYKGYAEIFEVPNSVTKIGFAAFMESDVNEVVLHNNVTEISHLAFSDCSNLTEIYIYENVEKIGKETFKNCPNLTIYCDAESKPAGWNNGWNPSNRPVIWGGVVIDYTENLVYTLINNGTEYSVSKGSLSSSYYDITIPDTHEGLPVTYIADYGFVGCNMLTNIVIGENIRTIGTAAFYANAKLKNVSIIGQNLETIGGSAFYNTIIETINIPEGVISIGNSAFYNCANLTEIILPESLESLGISVFSSCTSLTSVHLGSNLNYIGRSAFSNCTSLQSIAIPEGVTIIDENTFDNCSSLNNVSLPQGLLNIKKEAFKNCSNLYSIYIPDSVSNIGNYAFASSALSTISLPTGINKISKGTYYNCNNLTYISTPPNVLIIEEEAFAYCNNLYSVGLSDGLTSIGRFAFNNCNSLTFIFIPNSVLHIGEGAFWGCNNIDYDNYNGLKYINNWLFGTTSQYLSSAILKESTIGINTYAFYNCNNLSYVYLPEGLKTIKNNAFYNCGNLAEIIIPLSVTRIEEEAFMFCTNITFKCRAYQRPSNWDWDWNRVDYSIYDPNNVIWGYTG